jgi:hypothetical protein
MSRLLDIGPGDVEARVTAQLRGLKRLSRRNRGDLDGAVTSAAAYAQKSGMPMWVYLGNSYGRAVWRVAHKRGDYADPVNNMGSHVFSVDPDLTVRKHEVRRPGARANPGVSYRAPLSNWPDPDERPYVGDRLKVVRKGEVALSGSAGYLPPGLYEVTGETSGCLILVPSRSR